MKKAIVVIVLIVLLAVIGTPVLSGILMERTLKKTFRQINRMNAETGTDLSYEIIDYDRNLFSSEIEWKIKFGDISALYGTDDIVFVERAKHGFTRVVSTTSLEKNLWFMDFLNKNLDGKNPLNIRTEYRYSGNFIVTITLDGFDWVEADEVFECMPGRLVTKVGKDLKHFDSEMTWEGFFGADKFVVNQVFMDSKLEKLSTYIWDGDVTVSVKNIESENKTGRFQLSNFKCEYGLDFVKTEKVLSIKAGIGADKIMGGSNQINDAFVEIGFNNVDSDGFEEFMQLYSQLMVKVSDEFKQEPGKNSKNENKEMKKRFATLGLQMAGASEKLLKQGLELQISHLTATLPQGQIKGDIALGLKKDMTMVQFVPIAVQPSLALDIFSLKSDFILPVKLVGENPKLLQPAFPGMQTGLFVKKGDDMIHQAETRNGKLFLNGHALRLP